MRTRRATTFLVALVSLAVGQGIAGAPAFSQVGGGANNLVQVVSTAEGSFAHRARVQAAAYGGDSAQSTNLARADSRDCTGCRSQAAALQAVFLTGDPSTVEVANAAVATTSDCSSCVAYAYAYQYVITTAGPVSLSPQGRQRISELNQQADAAVSEQLPLPELDERLDALAAQLRGVVDTELRAAGQDADTRSLRDRKLAEL